MLLDLIHRGNSKEKIISHYSKFNIVERVIVDNGYLWNDKDYPSLYWKILAGIYYLLYKRHMPHIDNSYSTSVFEFDSSLKDDQSKIRSFYDIYIIFKGSYKPFNLYNIDTKLSSIGYYLEYLPSTKDKMILFIRELAIENKFHPVEKELCNSISFLLSINFMSFFESLLLFNYEQSNYIFESPSYDILHYESNIFKDEFFKNPNKNPSSIVTVIASKICQKYYPYVVLSLKKMLSGDFFIRNDDLMSTLYFCKNFFKPEVAKSYITDILLIMKYRKISPTIIMIFDRSLSPEYDKIEPTIEYISKHLTKIDITLLPITYSNYIDVAGNCKSVENFRKVITFIKNEGWSDIKSCIKKFIINSMKCNYINFGDLSDIDPNIYDIIIELKYDILASHICMSRIELIKISLDDSIGKWDLQNKKIIEAIGESCNVNILEQVYKGGQYTNEFIKLITLACYKKGSTVFADYFSHPIFTIFSLYSNVFNRISDEEIVNAIVESNNINLMKKYRFAITINNIDELISKTVVSNNFQMFMYLLSDIDYQFIEMKSLILKTAIYERITMLKILISFLLTKRKINNNEDINDFLLNILKRCVSSVSYNILNVFFNTMKYDYNESKVQLFDLRYVICKILKTSNKEWLEDNINVLPIFYLNFHNLVMKRKFYHRSLNSIYMSSDEESDEEMEL